MARTKLLFAGDTHANAFNALNIVERAKREKATLIIQVGDFAYTRDHRKNFLALLDKFLYLADLELWWVDGNHDDHDILDQLHAEFDEHFPARIRTLTSDRTWHLPRGYRWNWNGTSFLACGGAFSVDKQFRKPHRSWWEQETITEANIKRCGLEHADVMVTHDVPWGVENCYPPFVSKDGTIQLPRPIIEESAANRKMLLRIVEAVKPRLLIHGHCHKRNSEILTLSDGHQVQIEGLAHDGNADFEEQLYVLEI